MCDDLAGYVEQGVLVSRSRALNAMHMGTDLEVPVIHPDRAATAERSSEQPLPEAGKAADAFLDRITDRCQLQTRAGVEHQNRAHLHGLRADVGRQHHQVVWAHAVDSRD